jgi:hypothetical protein
MTNPITKMVLTFAMMTGDYHASGKVVGRHQIVSHCVSSKPFKTD